MQQADGVALVIVGAEAVRADQLGQTVPLVRRFDGPAATGPGEILYTNSDWHAPALKDLTQTPLHIPAGSGFEFECNYENHSGEPVNWGFTAAEEMCQIALVYTPGEATRHCDIVESGVR